jgi:hypothetical protein
LSEGDFIDVKRELTAGEQRMVFSGLVRDMQYGEKIRLVPEQVGLTKLLAYLVGWSFVDADGKPVPVSETAINALDSETYAEMVAVIDAHEVGVEEARAIRKNALAGESKSPATSESPA